MWYLNNIPKVAHFYWGGKKLSFLQFMSVYTFWKLNPDWTIKLHTTYSPEKKITWNTNEQNYPENYADFFPKIGQLPIKYVYHNLEAYSLPSNLTEVHKSDILRLKILSQEGGLYSDIDILFIKPMNSLECNIPVNSDKDTFVSICHYGHSIGFLMSSPRNYYYKVLYNKAKEIVDAQKCEGYQSIGSLMINKDYRDISKIIGNVYNFTMDTVYPYNANRITDLFCNNIDKTTEKTIGIHWYAGHSLAGDYLNKTDGGLINLPDCVITRQLQKVKLGGTLILKPLLKYSEDKVFLFGISGTGKTTFAQNYANEHNLRYVDFDLYFGLISEGWTNDSGADKFLRYLPEKFITEHIPSIPSKLSEGLEAYYSPFLNYCKLNQVQIIIADCSNKEEHLKRLKEKKLEVSDLNVNLEAVELFKKHNLKVSYYDSRTI